VSLHRLLSERRQELLARWARAAEESFAGSLSQVELMDRMPRFLDDLLLVLASGGQPDPKDTADAEEHGLQRFRLGFDIAEVVREYGLLHEAIIALAAEAGVVPTHRDAQVLASELSKGSCEAVTQYQAQRDAELQRQAAAHLGFIAHELRNPLASAQLAHVSLRLRYPEGGRSLETLGRSLTALTEMIDNVLSNSWLKVGAPLRGEDVDVRALLSQIESDVSEEAEAKGVSLRLEAESLVVHADRRLLASALSNLVRNAVKFTKPDTTIRVRAWRQEGRVLVEVEDGCGGLPPGKVDELFSPFVQRGADRSGFGLGLAITRQAAESHNGSLRVRDIPGQGCVFTIDLPAAVPPTP